MDWKEFFGLDKRKIWLFIFLCVLSVIIITSLSICMSIEYHRAPEERGQSGLYCGIIVYPITYFFIPFSGIIFFDGSNSTTLFTKFLFIFEMIYLYILSCLIIFLYDKFKNRKLKKNKK
jgi:hypothetical protein